MMYYVYIQIKRSLDLGEKPFETWYMWCHTHTGTSSFH